MSHVDLSPIYGQLNELVVLFLTGLASWLVIEVKGWLSAHAKLLGEQTDAQLADGLNRALQNGIAIALNSAQEWETVHKNADVRGQVTAWAAQYAIDHSPAAMARFGLSPEQLATKALAYLPNPVMQGAAAPVPPVTVTTLAPVHG